MTVLEELNQIIDLLEAEIPANPQSLKNQRLRKKLERELADYFDKLEQAFPYSKLSGIYNKYVKESVSSEAENILDPMLATLRATLTKRLNTQLLAVWLSGQAEMITWGKTKGGIPIAYEGPPISQAIDWAEKHCAKLVTQMDEETKRRLAQAVSNGIKNKRGVQGLSRDIKNQFDNMSRYRSQMIARTETADALSQTSLDSMKDMGIDGKECVTAGNPCDICLENEAAGVIPVDQPFPSGDMGPPFHPNCECSLAPARLNR